MFSRADWTLFRNANSISQKAGVRLQKLRRVVFKEMVDNALDAVHGQKVEFGKTDKYTYWVEDKGPGIKLPPDKLAQLFSINRPLTSTKVLRRPSRGALGNGLRVIVGTAMASGGHIVLETLGKKYEFKFNDANGTSEITNISPSSVHGTKLTVKIGEGIPDDSRDDRWAALANAMHMAKTYTGKSSPWWYDSDSFFELLMSAEGQSTTWLIQQFESIKGGMMGDILEDMPAGCQDVDRDQADTILSRLRTFSKPISPKKIGNVDYASKLYGEITINPARGEHAAVLPYCVEAYASPVNDTQEEDTDETSDVAHFFVNSTPITGDITIERRGKVNGAIFGCGLHHKINKISRRKFHVFCNVTIPYMPITTDGKEPNFEYMVGDINKVISKATARFKTAMKKKDGGAGQKEIIIQHLDEAIAMASGNGQYRYSLRQLFYAVRPFVLEKATNSELEYNHFARVITEQEAIITEQEAIIGELPGIYRDPRGTLRTPHDNQSVSIGTIAVENYKRPDWMFNKILYCEKEGFFEVLRQAKWAERNDCALLSSKGFASRAVRDLLDLLGETEEEIQFFCIHDADASGTLIYQALTEETKARAARRVKIINLGLDPWEAVDRGLQIERFEAKNRKLPVANFVTEYDDDNDEEWAKWLQTQRVELNAMTSPQFLEWLDEKIEPYTKKGKLIPPPPVLERTALEHADKKVREVITEQILREAGFDARVKARMDELAPRIRQINVNRLKTMLNAEPEDRWHVPLEELTDEIIAG